MIIPKIQSADLDRTSVLSSESLQAAKSMEIAAPYPSPEHISEALAAIYATLDRRPMGKILEQGGGIAPKRALPDKKQTPSLVTTSYPIGGAAFAARSVLSHRRSSQAGG